jgi:hypothetical protein
MNSMSIFIFMNDKNTKNGPQYGQFYTKLHTVVVEWQEFEMAE